jgi:hydroxymethylpyrimidine/phosphomethylpyrimidine kinase
MINAAKILNKLGAKNVLIKGGHLNSKFTEDVLLSYNEIFVFKNRRINTSNTHGTGCTLSSAIATYYSCGKTIKKSCEMAIKYVNRAIKTQPNYGKGQGPINHLNTIIIDKNFK